MVPASHEKGVGSTATNAKIFFFVPYNLNYMINYFFIRAKIYMTINDIHPDIILFTRMGPLDIKYPPFKNV